MTGQGGKVGDGTYHTEIQCDECLTFLAAEFEDPTQSFSVTCPDCGAYYPEVYV